MKTFHDQWARLELQTFDPAAFEGNDQVPQTLCNFVLALALIYNDCKNMTYAADLLKGCKPTGKPEKTAEWGTYNGIDRHLFRLMVSAVHELFNLINDHEAVLTHEFFVKVVKQLHPTSRKSWQALTSAANGATPQDEFGHTLLRIRNKIVFHYEPKEIFRGFKRQFLGATHLQDRAYISRELSMEASRFYFADAAVDGYIQEMVGQDDVRQLSAKIHDAVESLNWALLGLVDRFIQHRGFAYGDA